MTAELPFFVKSDIESNNEPLHAIQTWARMRSYLANLRVYILNRKMPSYHRIKIHHEIARVEVYIERVEKNVSIQFMEVETSREDWCGENGY